MQTIRDGLLSAHDLAGLLPVDEIRLAPGALLALVDGAALTRTPTDAARTVSRAPVHHSAHHPVVTSAPEPVHDYRTGDRTGGRTANAPRPAAPSAPTASGPGSRGRDERTDDELVAELHRHAERNGGPVSQREVMRLLGVGTPKAKRLAVLAGWAEPTPSPRRTGDPDNDPPDEPADHNPGQLALVSAPGQQHATTSDDDTDIPARNSR